MSINKNDLSNRYDKVIIDDYKVPVKKGIIKRAINKMIMRIKKYVYLMQIINRMVNNNDT